MLWLDVKLNYFKIISAFVDVPTELIPEAYCSSWIFSNMFNVAEKILK